MRLPVPWNMAVPHDNVTLAYKFLRMSASHFVMYFKEVSWNPLVSLPLRLGWNKKIDALETISANRDDASVWELEGLRLVNFRNRFELCVVIQTKVARILYDICDNLPLCGGREKAPSLSEDLHEMITASQAKDGVRQSVTFVNGHCELCVVIQTNVARFLDDNQKNLP